MSRGEGERSMPPLHNFTLPHTLKWGHQRLLRCMKPRSPDPTILKPITPSPAFVDTNDSSRPWNLRTRRAAAENPTTSGTNCESSPARRLRNAVNCGGVVVKKKRAKFSVSLSKDEVDLDFFILFGARPKKPKKRSKILQRQIDMVCPGSWLTEITADRYKVPDIPELGKS